MAPNIKALLAQGKPTNYVPWKACQFESAFRRGRRRMCEGCQHGLHSLCESEECPCVCNDSDFRWARRKSA